ncbi:hypothetical protein Y032_0041g343 [Ancylostoma ceylanicum]|uniref:Uncharacterized protein n=1 Tax=Ancylostoma ceylanicum TaxID=53326 RepID=A0A016UFM3_9BILA|nr:hypothetical protein Y032_0041g343 [Ancylostoma ceylanicum]
MLLRRCLWNQNITAAKQHQRRAVVSHQHTLGPLRPIICCILFLCLESAWREDQGSIDLYNTRNEMSSNPGPQHEPKALCRP